MGVGFDPSCQNMLVWVNPVAGGTRGAEIGEGYQRDLFERGISTFQLNPERPDKMSNGTRVEKYLTINPYGNSFFLRTTENPQERQEALQRALEAIHYARDLEEDARPPVLLIAGGDGTIIEAKQAAAAVAGLSPETLFEDRLGRETTRELLTHAPRLSAPRFAGTACDLTMHLGEMKEGNLMDYLAHCEEAVIPSSMSSLPYGDRNILLDTTHTISFGSIAYLFERAERTKHTPPFEGSLLNYLKEGPVLLTAKAMAALSRNPDLRDAIRVARENPVDPFWVHYSLNDEPEITLHTGDLLATGLLFVAKGLHSPNPLNDGIKVYFMPASTPHLMLIMTESAIRGRWMMLRQAQERAWFPGRHFSTLPQERSLRLSPGDLLKIRFSQDRKGEKPCSPRCQGNGGPLLFKGSSVEIRATDPYPVLSHEGSLVSGWQHSPQNQVT